jgi:hypothetical protein
MTTRFIRTGMMAYMGLTEALARETSAPAQQAVLFGVPKLRAYANVPSTHGSRRNVYDHNPVQVTYVRRMRRATRVYFTYPSPIQS